MAVITASDIWKSFRIYEQRTHTLKETLLARRTKYHAFWAVQGVSFSVDKGEMVGIIGPNGSGKSTLLKCLTGVLAPNRGSIQVEGKVSSLLELGTGFHPELGGRDNVYLAGSIMGLSRQQIDDRFDEIVDFSGVHDFIDMPVKNYSSGMYARLAFALAINVDADVLLVDEVLSVGDEAFQTKCHDHIIGMRDAGTTIVFVSHSLYAVRNLCNRALWLDHGQVVKEGPAAEVVATYFEEAHEGEHGAFVAPPEGGRVGTQQAVITSVELLDANGTSTPRFHTGDACTLRMRYEAKEALDDVVASAEIRTIANDLVAALSSLDEGAMFNLPAGSGTIDYSIPALPIPPSDLRLTVALHDWKRHRIYDWHEQAIVFSVDIGGLFRSGLMWVPGHWLHKEGS